MRLCDLALPAYVVLGLLGSAQAIPATQPVNPKADNATAGLLARLVNVASKGATLSDQQGLKDADWLAENVGFSPAILGINLMGYSPSRAEFGAAANTIEDAIAYSKRGGSPSGSYNTSDQPWYSNFYTEATSFNLAAAMNPASPDYKLIIRDIDAIAEQLFRVRDIPILFRPLHEADGGWFWWSAAGTEPCKALYQLMYDRLTNTHGLNNLLWVWNSKEPDWYPGNEVVDIVSVDIYADNGDHSSQIADYQALQGLTGNATKPVALAEVGNIPDPELMKKDGAGWAYWVTWNGDFIEGETNNPMEFKEQVYSSKVGLYLGRAPGVTIARGLVWDVTGTYEDRKLGLVSDVPIWRYGLRNCLVRV